MHHEHTQSRVRSAFLLYAVFAILGIAVVWLGYAPFRVVFEPAVDVDTSYRMVLGQMHSLGLKVGGDLVYTFGPLGFVVFQSLAKFEQAIAIVVFPLFTAGLFIALGCWARAVGDGARAWMLATSGCVVLGLFGFAEPLMLFALPGGLALLCLTTIESDWNPWLRRLLLLLLAVSALTKFSYFVLNLVLVVAVAAAQSRVGRRWPIAAVEYAVALAALWLASGQRLAAFGTYVRDSWRIASGYGALGAAGGELEQRVLPFLLAAVVLIAAAATVLSVSRSGRWPRLVLSGAWAAFLLVSFKIGFAVFSTSHFFHQCLRYYMLAAGTAAIAACVMPLPRTRRALALSASVAAFVLLAVLPQVIGMRAEVSWKTPASLWSRSGAGWDDARRWWVESNSADHVREAAYANIRQQYPLPPEIDAGDSVDVYPDEQAIVLAAGVRYSPRPSFQGIATLSSAVAERNARFLATAAAPDYILFAPPSPRGATSTVIDGPTWPELLARYDPTADRVGNHIVFKRRTSPQRSRLIPIGSFRASVGEVIELPETTGIVWADLKLKPSVFGRLALLVARLPQATLVRETPDGAKASGLPIKLLDSGFLISPVIETADDLVALDSATLRAQLDRKATKRIRVEVEYPALYSSDYTVGLYRLEFY